MMLWVDGNDDGAVITTAAWLLIIMIIQKMTTMFAVAVALVWPLLFIFGYLCCSKHVRLQSLQIL